jgi:hypothetical protein
MRPMWPATTWIDNLDTNLWRRIDYWALASESLLEVRTTIEHSPSCIVGNVVRSIRHNSFRPLPLKENGVSCPALPTRHSAVSQLKCNTLPSRPSLTGRSRGQ